MGVGGGPMQRSGKCLACGGPIQRGEAAGARRAPRQSRKALHRFKGCRACFVGLILFPVFDYVYSHVLSQNLRNDHASVGLLAVFQNSRNGSAYRKAGAV